MGETQGFAACEFPRGWAEIGHAYKRLPRGSRSRENKMADLPPKTTRSRISPATQATPWQEISLTPYDDSSFNLVLFNLVQFNERPFEFV